MIIDDSEVGNWYLVVTEHGANAIKRGPYQFAESAGAVREEMERNFSDDFDDDCDDEETHPVSWNICVMQITDRKAFWKSLGIECDKKGRRRQAT